MITTPCLLEEMAPGLLRVRLPLPGPPGHVNAWLIEDEEGWFLVDTGWGDSATRSLWDRLLAGRRVTRLLVTHAHPDHLGLAGSFCADWGVPLLMPRSEWQRARLLLLEEEPVLTALFIGLQRAAGAPAEHLRQMTAQGIAYRRIVAPLPPTFQAIADGDALCIGGRDWRVMVGAGHSIEMACLYDETRGLLISADHILPRISPHVGLHPTEPDGDPLAVFLSALRRFQSLPAGTRVLPSHGEPFIGLHERIVALLAHHEATLERLQAAMGPGMSGMEALLPMFGRHFEGRQLGFALAEALAHLNHLVAQDRCRRFVDDEGCWRYRSPSRSDAVP